MSKAIWYADGLRWIGSVLNGAADRLERNVAEPALLDPSEYRAIDEYVSEVRSRVHVQF